MKQIFMLAFLVSTSATAQDVSKPVALTSKQKVVVQRGVAAALKDPDSARFDRPFMAASDAAGSITVCGYVNAKNSYGGYTGPVAFGGSLMKKGTVFLTFGIGKGGASGDYSVSEVCRQSGINIE